MTKKIHIIGIGGTFMGNLALIAKQLGYEVVGTDHSIYSPMREQLQNYEILALDGYNPEYLETKPDLVIVGNSISRGNAIIENVINNRIPYLSGPDWLRNHLIPQKKVLAIAGTHGKTTTTAMAAHIFQYSGFDPGYLIGGVSNSAKQPAQFGKGDWFVLEADEYDSAFFDKRSKFLHYRPDILVIGNLEFDHADIFDTFNDIKKQFKYLLRTIPANGHVLINNDCEELNDLVKNDCWSNIVRYGSQESNAGWHAIARNKEHSIFDIYFESRHIFNMNWSIIGKHNMTNALAAIAACTLAGVNPKSACEAMKTFKLPKRRLERLNPGCPVALFDDFAHHPTAIQETISSLKAAYPNGKLISIVEPRSNTMKSGLHEKSLINVIKKSDISIIKDGGDLKWNPRSFTGKYEKSEIIVSDNDSEIAKIVKANAYPGDQIVLMSNGDLEKLKGLLTDYFNKQIN